MGARIQEGGGRKSDRKEEGVRCNRREAKGQEGVLVQQEG